MLVNSLVDMLSTPEFWEYGMFHGNIAWEYSRSRDASEAVFNEVSAVSGGSSSATSILSKSRGQEGMGGRPSPETSEIRRKLRR